MELERQCPPGCFPHPLGSKSWVHPLSKAKCGPGSGPQMGFQGTRKPALLVRLTLTCAAPDTPGRHKPGSPTRPLGSALRPHSPALPPRSLHSPFHPPQESDSMESGPGVGRPWALAMGLTSGRDTGRAGSEGRSGITLGSAFWARARASRRPDSAQRPQRDP